MGGDPVGAVASLCSELIADLDTGPALDAVRQIHEGLREPLRVAVGGRVKAGKSTLVNALIGTLAAPVAAEECTKAVYWYRYADVARIEVVPRRSPSYRVPFVDGAIPGDLGTPTEEIDRVDVWLRSPALKDLVVIDTPGLESLNTQYGDKTKEFLGIGDDDRAAVSKADVLVYLMPHVKATDKLTLESFRAALPSSQLTALNSIGVLSRIDTLTDDPDPWPAARRVAQRYTNDLSTLLATVVPIIGKLAETVNGDVLTETHFRDLCEIAQIDTAVWRFMSTSVDMFATDSRCNISTEHRDELLDLLGIYACRRSVEWIRDGTCRSLGELAEQLRDESGIVVLQHYFSDAFTNRAGVIKPGVGMAHLASVYWTYRDSHRPLAALLAKLETLEQQPEMHQLVEMRVMRALASGSVSLAEDLIAEMLRVVKATTPAAKVGLPESASWAEIRRVAGERESQWNGIEQSARFSQQAYARAVKLSYGLLREHLAG